MKKDTTSQPLAASNATEPTTFVAPNKDETLMLAREVSKIYQTVIEDYQRFYHKDEAEAIECVNNSTTEKWIENILVAPPDQVSWRKMSDLARRDPQLMQHKWAELKGIALAELQSGHRAAGAIETPVSEPTDLARFLAVRHDLMQEWQPQSGIESALIDQMAQFHWQYLHWLKILCLYSTTESERPSPKTAKWQPPQVADAEAIDTAAAMVDRFNKLFLRTLRALRDMRRHPIIVQNASQVNVGHQQINLPPTKNSRDRTNQ